MKELLGSLRRLAPEFAMSDDVVVGDLHLAAYNFATAREVGTWVTQAGLVSGWSILWGGSSTVWMAIEPDAFDLDGAHPGDGEFHAIDEVTKASITLHVRHQGPIWRCTAYSRKADLLERFGPSDGTKVVTGLRQTRRFLVDKRFHGKGARPGLKARYHVWWAEDELTGFGPVVDVFDGFEDETASEEEGAA